MSVEHWASNYSLLDCFASLQQGRPYRERELHFGVLTFPYHRLGTDHIPTLSPLEYIHLCRRVSHTRKMSGLVQWVLETQHSLSTTPVHPTYFPFAWLDVLGAIRLSVFVDQFSRQRNKVKPEEIGEKKRGTWLQECCGLLLLMFGGETLLCMSDA
jgi:hypothetical protein